MSHIFSTDRAVSLLLQPLHTTLLMKEMPGVTWQNYQILRLNKRRLANSADVVFLNVRSDAQLAQRGNNFLKIQVSKLFLFVLLLLAKKNERDDTNEQSDDNPTFAEAEKSLNHEDKLCEPKSLSDSAAFIIVGKEINNDPKLP